MIPTVEQCFEIMAKYEMLDNIKEHSIVVEKIARAIAQELKEPGSCILSLEKISSGALLHDIGKMRGILNGESPTETHADMGRKICLENNLDEIADIVGEHLRLKDFDPDSRVNEKEIVYYADKRVTHDAIVGLMQRLDYLLKRYGNNNQVMCDRIRENMALCARVEKKLFLYLPFEPNELASIIDKRENTIK